jgi:hypothetical protein
VPAVKRQKINGLLRDDDSDDDSDDEIDISTPSSAPWMIELNRYLNTNDIMPPGMTVVEWWGVRDPYLISLIITNVPLYVVKFSSLSNSRFTCS